MSARDPFREPTGSGRGTRCPVARRLSWTTATSLVALALAMGVVAVPSMAQDTAGGAPPSRAAAGQSAPTGSPVADEAVTADSEAVSQSVVAAQASVPAGPLAPRSLRPYWHVFVAFGITWLLLFGYAAVLWRRLAAVERDINRIARPGV